MERPDLGTLTSRLLREIVRRETPILDRAGLEMWDYVILSALLAGDAATQTELATSTGRDKTRLIRNLDGLEERGLVTRSPDPADRRNKVVSLTTAGRRLVSSCRTAIRAMEKDLLAGLPASERTALERSLLRLTTDG
ncbi:MAG TPA: MarR family transcriptional regulator [Nocardioides sp.]|nr:MarR family transcriptional regulator [Nocardioides sp.]